MREKYSAVGRTGEYVVAKDGIHPQAGDAFIYGDKKYRFWFYVEFVPQQEPQNYQLLVKDATTGRFEGVNPIVDVQDQPIIEENVRHYFEVFDLFGREITLSNPAPIVIFTWTLDSDSVQ